MEELNKALVTIHRTLILGTIALLAFALSDDPTSELRAANRAIQVISLLDTSRLTTAVAERYTREGNFSTEWIGAPNMSATSPASRYKCLSDGSVMVSLTLAVVAVPEAKTAPVATIIDHLAEADVFLIQASRKAMAEVLAQGHFNCDLAIADGLAAIRIGSRDIAIRSVPGVRREVRSLSSLERLKFSSASNSGAAVEERTFSLMTAIAKTATVELDYRKLDTIRTEQIVTDLTFASPAKDTLKNTFAIYFPQGDPTLVLGAIRRNLGAVGELAPSRAIELLGAKIEEKTKYPTVYGVEIRSSHAVWGLPALLLALASFLLIHVRSYRRAHGDGDAIWPWFPNTLLMSGAGASVVRAVSLLVLPAFSSALLVHRFAETRTWEAALAYFVCLMLFVVGSLLLRELHLLRDPQGSSSPPLTAIDAVG